MHTMGESQNNYAESKKPDMRVYSEQFQNLYKIPENANL